MKLVNKGVMLSGMLISSIFFILTAAIFFFVCEVSRVRGRCIIGYCVSMAASFICLSCAQLLRVEGETCNAFGE